MGLPQEQVLAFLQTKIVDKLEVEDYGSFESYTFSDNWLELQFRYGRLDEINLGVKFGHDDKPLWPNA